MSYADDASQLARALTDLLNTNPAPPGPLTAAEVQAALVCRDTVVGAVRDLTGALLRRTSPYVPDTASLLPRSPAHALQAALRDLPLAGGRDLALADALAVPAPPSVARWQDAARAAALLEAYRDDAADLPGPAAWSLARDLAALSSALPTLDLDLAATLTGASAEASHPAGPAAALLDEPSHGLLQLRAAELAAHTADVPAAAAALRGPGREPLRPVATLADLPAAGRQLAELLRARGHRLTLAEARAAVRTVVFGVDLTTRALTAAHDPALPGDDSQDAGGQLRQALPDLQRLLHTELATLTPPAPGVLLLSQQIQTRLAAADRLHNTLRAGAGTPAAHRALTQALLPWAITAAPVLQAAHDGLQAASHSRSLLGPRHDDAPGRDARLLWLPVHHSTAHPHPALHALDRAATALRGATSALTAPSDPTVALQPSGTQRAAADAAGAFNELSAALHSRPAGAWPNPTRTPHPALPHTTSRQRSQPQR